MAGDRVEEDSLGKREVPAQAYWGIQTLRAVESFPVSGLRASPHLIRAYGLLKLAAGGVNREKGVLDERRAKAIEQAAQEVADGRFNAEMVVDVFQAGAGTSFHMNVNEVIANRALEILGVARGSYEEIGPNDHVNLGQSTNDTYPSASQVAVLFAFQVLEAAVETLSVSLEKKGNEFADLPKAGRTHLKDAMPVSLGAEFHAYSTVLRHLNEQLSGVRAALAEIPLGGSAVGSGINTPPGFRSRVVEELSRLSGLPLKPARDPYESMESRWPLGAASAWLRALALELMRIANDVRLLSSGPATGLDEIRLPTLIPGSSIMPGKENPSAAECLNMVCCHVLGADQATAMAVQGGQLELNVMTPLATYEILFASEILTRYLPKFAQSCVDGITARPDVLERYLLESTAVATILTPRFGYLKVAEVIHQATHSGRSVKELLVERGMLTPPEVEQLLGPEALRRLAKPVS